jgi:sterol desaturase/sphingolipid hydroxylase (fatty acid hydroxylase superfamily)
MKKILKLILVQPTPLYFTFFTGFAFWIIFIMPKTINNWLMLLFIAPSAWTLQEYIIHRYVMHGSFLLIKKAHIKHHESTHDKTKIFIPIILTLSFSLINFLPLWFLCNRWLAFANLASNVLCYDLFELVHYNCHTYNKIQFLSGPKRFHILHHHYNIEDSIQRNYGFTSATWDIVFGTCDKNTLNSKWMPILLIPIPVLPLVLHFFLTYSYLT